MFDHSIKVPRFYKVAAKIVKEVSESKGSIKQFLYERKHPNIKGLYALVVHTFQKTEDIEKLLKRSKLLVTEPRLDPWLAKVLISELLWGKQCLPGQSKPIKTILAYEQIFKAHLSDAPNDDFQELRVDKPRYVRINTLKTTINEAVEEFRNEGWFLKRCTDNSYLGFLDTVRNLGSEEFMVDLHVPYLLIFPPKTQFYRHHAYKNSQIILQDKASCLPVILLNPEPGTTVLDMCAAPGMKTTQCAAIMENTGKIYAVEIGKKRFQILNEIIESAGATCVETINTDVQTLSGKQYPDVEYILVDPSCSGSGITDRVEIGRQEIEQPKYRLGKLAGFQIKTLRYALTRYPKARRVVYSTCSVYPEENEDVVRQVLETCTTFKLVPANQFLQGKWENFGSSEFGDIGNYCLYAKPDIDLTNGFFVAVFERLEEGETNQFLNTRIYSNIFNNRRKKKVKEEFEVGGQEEVKEKDEKKKSKRHDVAVTNSDSVKEECTSNQNLMMEDQIIKEEESQNLNIVKKKKKSKERVDHPTENVDAEGVQPDHKIKKIKKEKIHKMEISDDSTENASCQKNGSTEETSEDIVPKRKKKQDQDELEIFHADEDIVQKRNKKKKKQDQDDKEISNAEEDIAQERKKKKKKQDQDELEILNADEDIIHERNKKKKKQDQDDKEISNAEEDIAQERKKKKKKQDQDELEILNADEDIVQKRNKKKKKQDQDDTEISNADEDIVQERKKKKKKQDQNDTEISNADEDMVQERKKKEKKQDQDELQISNVDEVISTQNKKKKKKAKHVDTGEDKTTENKKRKKIETNESLEYLDCENNESHRQQKIKKKKTKK